VGERKARGKTKTIKQRTVYVYLPSEKAVTAWQKEAERHGVSLSQFVFESVEAGIDPAKAKVRAKSNPDELAERVADLEAQLKKAHADGAVKDAALEKLQADLTRYRVEQLKPKKGAATRQYDRKLIEVIQRKGEISNLDLLTALRVAPSDRELVEAYREHLDRLAEWGIITPTANGWRWRYDRK
jgi:stalled ribosome alternative rescue factor ArfA